MTTIYVTHDQVEAMGLGDRFVVMNKGRVCQLGTPSEIYQWPADTFVATFVGSPPMNLIEQDSVLVGFRPETFLPVKFVEESYGVVTYAFRVTWLEYLGAERLVYGDIGRKTHARHVVSKLPSNLNVSIEAGQTYSFAVSRPDIRHFDRSSGLLTDTVLA